MNEENVRRITKAAFKHYFGHVEFVRVSVKSHVSYYSDFDCGFADRLRR